MARRSRKRGEAAQAPLPDAPEGDPSSVTQPDSAEEVELAWCEIEPKALRIAQLVNGLTADEQVHLGMLAGDGDFGYETKWWEPFALLTVAEGLASTVLDGIERAKEVAKEVRDHYTPKPRMTERDDEIVRLRDEEQLSWKEIRKKIRGDPRWAKGRNGKPISEGALRLAYNRHKKPSRQKNA
jgi:hypothetical protein